MLGQYTSGVTHGVTLVGMSKKSKKKKMTNIIWIGEKI